jgi:hypothetical protein
MTLRKSRTACATAAAALGFLLAASASVIGPSGHCRARNSSAKLGFQDLEAAALNSTGEINRLHCTEMAVQMDRLLRIGMS